MSNVSDEEAMRALLSSAETRSREREGNEGRGGRGGGRGGRGGRGGDRGGRWGDRDDRNNPNRKRSRFDTSSKNKKYDDRNDSYYGPSNNNDDKEEGERERSRQRRRSNDNDNTATRVESDDDDDKKKESKDGDEEEKPEPEFKPNFGLSGALSKDTQSGNVYKGVVLKFKEPPEARAPNTQWRFYVFKKGVKDVIETLHVSKQSAYLLGRNTDIADIAMHHPSLSSQHAVLQYRALP
ncbi:MAG: hypothetical protein SGILL_010861, partial [Bacillariaceae sp.]